MERRDKVAFWLFLILFIGIAKETLAAKHYLEAASVTVVLALYMWLITCYKRLFRSKVTAVSTLALTITYMILTWKFNGTVNLDNPFAPVMAVATLFWWLASKSDFKDVIPEK